jgi:two-component system, cell cycle sensor histidine kinase and response regulator CckA
MPVSLERDAHMKPTSEPTAVLADRESAAALEQAGEAILITDAEGTILSVNAAFERITGYARTDAIGQTPRILRSGEHRGVFFRELWDTIRRGDPWSGRLINRRPSGDCYRAELSISPIRDADGAVVRHLGILRDITTEVEVEEKLRLAQKMEALGHLASGIAHDFNNALTPILAYSELSLMELPESHAIRAYISEILGSAEHGASLSRQLLAFGRKREPEFSTVELNEVVGGLERMIRRVIREDIHITFHLDPEAGMVLADAAQVEQVIMNLVLNARDAMPEGGALAVSTHRPGTRRLPGGSAPTPGYAALEVRDTGPGIDPAIAPHLFEPFFTTKPPGEGTGLGLTTVRSIVAQHEGRVTWESQPGEGAVFRVFLPVASAATAAAHSREAVTLARGSETVLLVEDDAGVRSLAAELLRRIGYVVFDFGDAEQALNFFREADHPMDLLLADLVLPDFNGRILYQRALERQPRLRALFMTGYGPSALSKMGLDGEHADLLRKPFTIYELARRVRETLDRSPPAG